MRHLHKRFDLGQTLSHREVLSFWDGRFLAGCQLLMLREQRLVLGLWTGLRPVHFVDALSHASLRQLWYGSVDELLDALLLRRDVGGSQTPLHHFHRV